MTSNEPAWIDHSSGAILQYDYRPPAGWPAGRVAAEQLAMAAMIEAADVDAPAPGWLRLATRLPAGLRGALTAELRAGNRLAGIGSSGWPGEGSIVVNLAERFTAARRALPPGVRWRRLDDPRYVREELTQTVDTVEFLLVC
jgi:hypothetical protein